EEDDGVEGVAPGRGGDGVRRGDAVGGVRGEEARAAVGRLLEELLDGPRVEGGFVLHRGGVEDRPWVERRAAALQVLRGQGPPFAALRASDHQWPERHEDDGDDES